MARRPARKAKSKPVKPAKTTKPRRGRRGGDLEVTDQADVAKASPWSLESGLVLVTLLALVVSFLLIEIEMSGSYGSTWPF